MNTGTPLIICSRQMNPLHLFRVIVPVFALFAPIRIEATTYAYRPTKGICAAAVDGDLVKVDRFVDSDINAINERDGGCTPLHWAAVYGHVAIVEYLLDHGADANAVAGESKLTPLHYAAHREPNEVLRLLLAHGADPRALTSRGESVLNFACSYGRRDSMLERVRLLLDAGAKPDPTPDQLSSPLQSAAFFGLLTILELLLDHGADIDSTGFHGSTALHYAVSGQHFEAVKFLLDRGADINACDEEGKSALVWAKERVAEKYFWRRGKLKRIIKLLVERGAKE